MELRIFYVHGHELKPAPLHEGWKIEIKKGGVARGLPRPDIQSCSERVVRRVSMSRVAAAIKAA